MFETRDQDIGRLIRSLPEKERTALMGILRGRFSNVKDQARIKATIRRAFSRKISGFRTGNG